MSEFRYVGSELDLFAAAKNWKAYWSARIAPYLVGDVLEVGAGIGSNTTLLGPKTAGRWVCLEPDPNLVSLLVKNLSEAGGTRGYESVCGTIGSLHEDEHFDTILYIDVLEHIEDDAGELERAATRLRQGGRIVVLSPAHQWLFTAFDANIGHFRRYNKASLRKASPPGMSLETIFYLDACGIMASAANRVLLRQSLPTSEQIGVWDKWIVPASRVLDPMLAGSLGKSIIAVWRKPV